MLREVVVRNEERHIVNAIWIGWGISWCGVITAPRIAYRFVFENCVVDCEYQSDTQAVIAIRDDIKYDQEFFKQYLKVNENNKLIDKLHHLFRFANKNYRGHYLRIEVLELCLANEALFLFENIIIVEDIVICTFNGCIYFLNNYKKFFTPSLGHRHEVHYFCITFIDNLRENQFSFGNYKNYNSFPYSILLLDYAVQHGITEEIVSWVLQTNYKFPSEYIEYLLAQEKERFGKELKEDKEYLSKRILKILQRNEHNEKRQKMLQEIYDINRIRIEELSEYILPKDRHQIEKELNETERIKEEEIKKLIDWEEDKYLIHEYLVLEEKVARMNRIFAFYENAKKIIRKSYKVEKIEKEDQEIMNQINAKLLMINLKQKELADVRTKKKGKIKDITQKIEKELLEKERRTAKEKDKLLRNRVKLQKEKLHIEERLRRVTFKSTHELSKIEQLKNIKSAELVTNSNLDLNELDIEKKEILQSSIKKVQKELVALEKKEKRKKDSFSQTIRDLKKKFVVIRQDLEQIEVIVNKKKEEDMLLQKEEDKDDLLIRFEHKEVVHSAKDTEAIEALKKKKQEFWQEIEKEIEKDKPELLKEIEKEENELRKKAEKEKEEYELRKKVEKEKEEKEYLQKELKIVKEEIEFLKKELEKEDNELLWKEMEKKIKEENELLKREIDIQIKEENECLQNELKKEVLTVINENKELVKAGINRKLEGNSVIEKEIEFKKKIKGYEEILKEAHDENLIVTSDMKKELNVIELDKKEKAMKLSDPDEDDPSTPGIWSEVKKQIDPNEALYLTRENIDPALQYLDAEKIAEALNETVDTVKKQLSKIDIYQREDLKEITMSLKKDLKQIDDEKVKDSKRKKKEKDLIMEKKDRLNAQIGTDITLLQIMRAKKTSIRIDAQKKKYLTVYMNYFKSIDVDKKAILKKVMEDEYQDLKKILESEKEFDAEFKDLIFDAWEENLVKTRLEELRLRLLEAINNNEDWFVKWEKNLDKKIAEEKFLKDQDYVKQIDSEVDRRLVFYNHLASIYDTVQEQVLEQERYESKAYEEFTKHENEIENKHEQEKTRKEAFKKYMKEEGTTKLLQEIYLRFKQGYFDSSVESGKEESIFNNINDYFLPDEINMDFLKKTIETDEQKVQKMKLQAVEDEYLSKFTVEQQRFIKNRKNDICSSFLTIDLFKINYFFSVSDDIRAHIKKEFNFNDQSGSLLNNDFIDRFDKGLLIRQPPKPRPNRVLLDKALMRYENFCKRIEKGQEVSDFFKSVHAIDIAYKNLKGWDIIYNEMLLESVKLNESVKPGRVSLKDIELEELNRARSKYKDITYKLNTAMNELIKCEKEWRDEKSAELHMSEEEKDKKLEEYKNNLIKNWNVDYVETEKVYIDYINKARDEQFTSMREKEKFLEKKRFLVSEIKKLYSTGLATKDLVEEYIKKLDQKALMLLEEDVLLFPEEED